MTPPAAPDSVCLGAGANAADGIPQKFLELTSQKKATTDTDTGLRWRFKGPHDPLGSHHDFLSPLVGRGRLLGGPSAPRWLDK